MKRTILALTALTFLAVSIAPAGAATRKVPVWDTAWQLPTAATMNEVDDYFKHLSEAGFTGAWISVLDLMNTGVNVNGDRMHGWEGTNFWVEQAQMDRMRSILETARKHQVQVGIVPAWGLSYLHSNSHLGCKDAALHQGPLTKESAYGYGWMLGDGLKDYTDVIGMWIMGGDNFCERGDGAIWENLTNGVEDGTQSRHIPVAFHTPALSGRQHDFAHEWWVDVMLPQTGHCATPEESSSQLASVKAVTEKPVYAGELRYLGIEPSWNCGLHGEGRPVTGDDVVADANAALRAGVDGLSYGVNGRWQWGKPIHGAAPGDHLSKLGHWTEGQVINAAGGKASKKPPVQEVTQETVEEVLPVQDQIEQPATTEPPEAEAEAAGALPRPEPDPEAEAAPVIEAPVETAPPETVPPATEEEVVALSEVFPVDDMPEEATTAGVSVTQREEQNRLLQAIALVLVLIAIAFMIRGGIRDWKRGNPASDPELGYVVGSMVEQNKFELMKRKVNHEDQP